MTREVKDAVIGRSDKVDERCDTGRLIEHLGPGDVLFMDCGISATWLFGKCRDRGIDFVGRISNSWKPKILKTLGDGDYLVSVSAYVPDAYRGAACSVRLKLRMIAYQVGDDEPVRVLTSLRDPGKYPPREIALGYHLRWESELTFDEQKVHFVALQHGKQKTVFRSKTPEGVRQEVYGLLICYNLIRRLMLEAAATANVDPRYLSFVDSVRLIKLATTAYQKRCTPEWQAAVLNQLLADVAQTLNPRPRRPRHYPRLVKIKMSNYGCKTRTRGAGRHRDYVSELRNKPVVPPQLASSLAWLSSLLTALASQGPVSALVLLATDATLLKP